MEFSKDIFDLFGKRWALVTAGTEEDFNTMTIGWGGLGTIWGKPMATVYVRTSRYTHEFMEKCDQFTISFYPEEYRKVLGTLGSNSGRDMDKIHDSGLTPMKAGGSVSFREAEVTLVCRKLLCERLDEDRIPEDILKKYYDGDDPHDMYIGEVVEIIEG